MVSVCFVCLGNICRSPSADGVMRSLLQERHLVDSVHVESAGTSAWHVGERPDPRSRAAASTRGVTVDGHAQHFVAQDFERFDYVLAMDRSNKADILTLAASEDDEAKVHLFLDFAPEHQEQDVPDPYYGGVNGFEHVLDLCESACAGLIDHMSERGEI